MRRWLFVGSVCLILAAPAAAAQPAWKGLINDWLDNGAIDHRWRCSAYRVALSHLPDEVDTYTTARQDLARNLDEGNCLRGRVIHNAEWIGPKSATQTDRWSFYVAGAAVLLVSAAALGVHRARRSTRA